jgi:hypothetical protein
MTIVNVDPPNKRWTLQGNKVADIDVGMQLFVTSNTGNGNGTYTVQSAVLLGSDTVVTVYEPIFTTATPDGSGSVPIRASDVYTIIGVNPGLQQWTISGAHTTGILFNQEITITGAGAGSGKYLVLSAVLSGGNTVITVKGTVNPAATPTGTIELQRLPRWVSGTKVELEGSGILPVPLAPNTPYYFIPQSTPGVFNLAHRRYPQQLSEFVDITTLGTGETQIKRDELYYPGAAIRVDNTYLSTNNGVYYVKDTQEEGSQYRIRVMQGLKGPHGGVFSVAGTMSAVGAGYDEPSYCPISTASALHTDLFIHELLQFTIEMRPVDGLTASLVENSDEVYGWGIAPYSYSQDGPFGSVLLHGDIPERYAVTSGTVPDAGAGVMLPMGYDVQVWDLGGMGETVHDLRNYYNRTLP